jgi:hypothetical protein
LGSLAELLYRNYQSSQFRPITPPLQYEVVATGNGITCGLPWPWSQVPEPSGPSGTEAMLQAQAPRSDMPATFSVWRDMEPGDLESVLSTAGRQISQTYGGRVQGVRKLLIGGTRGVLVRVSNPGHRCVVWRLVTELEGRLVHGEARVPAMAADGTEPQLETMLATWSWS